MKKVKMSKEYYNELEKLENLCRTYFVLGFKADYLAENIKGVITNLDKLSVNGKDCPEDF